VDSWKSSFLKKLHEVQFRCAQQFEDVLDRMVVPVFDDLAAFLAENHFKVATPLTEPSRRSFKFELSENAYLLVIFRFTGVDEFELRSETFVPSGEPVLERLTGRTSEMRKDWAQKLFQAGLDRFIELLSNQESETPSEALAAV
jgi:hypothetical protein